MTDSFFNLNLANTVPQSAQAWFVYAQYILPEPMLPLGSIWCRNRVEVLGNFSWQGTVSSLGTLIDLFNLFALMGSWLILGDALTSVEPPQQQAGHTHEQSMIKPAA